MTSQDKENICPRSGKLIIGKQAVKGLNALVSSSSCNTNDSFDDILALLTPEEKSSSLQVSNSAPKPISRCSSFKRKLNYLTSSNIDDHDNANKSKFQRTTTDEGIGSSFHQFMNAIFSPEFYNPQNAVTSVENVGNQKKLETGAKVINKERIASTDCLVLQTQNNIAKTNFSCSLDASSIREDSKRLRPEKNEKQIKLEPDAQMSPLEFLLDSRGTSLLNANESHKDRCNSDSFLQSQTHRLYNPKCNTKMCDLMQPHKTYDESHEDKCNGVNTQISQNSQAQKLNNTSCFHPFSEDELMHKYPRPQASQIHDDSAKCIPDSRETYLNANESQKDYCTNCVGAQKIFCQSQAQDLTECCSRRQTYRIHESQNDYCSDYPKLQTSQTYNPSANVNKLRRNHCTCGNIQNTFEFETHLHDRDYCQDVNSVVKNKDLRQNINPSHTYLNKSQKEYCNCVCVHNIFHPESQSQDLRHSQEFDTHNKDLVHSHLRNCNDLFSQENLKDKDNVREMSTQTSSHNNSCTSSPIIGGFRKNLIRLPLRLLPYEAMERYAPFPCLPFSQNTPYEPRQSYVSSQSNNFSSSQTSPPNPQPKHMLEVLSHDISVMADGVQFFNNISKVATQDWLRSAIATLPQRYTYTKATRRIITEVNSCSIYLNYVSNVRVKRYRIGKTKIFQLEKMPFTSNDKDSDALSNYEDVKEEHAELTDTKDSEYQLRCGIDQVCNDSSLLCSEYSVKDVDVTKVLCKIHSIFARLFDTLENKEIPLLYIKTTASCAHCIYRNGRLQWESSKKRILFGRQHFCTLLYILSKVYGLLIDQTKLTQREVYYQIKPVIGSASKVATVVVDVSRMLGIGPWHLNIISQDGLVYGDLTLRYPNGDTINCNTSSLVVPSNLEDIVEIRTDAYFILVIEKESIFRKLLEEDLPNKLTRPFIMITGKGMPSVNTRLFLNRISSMLVLPVFIMVDPDIYGIRIMLTYRFGAARFGHVAEELAVPNARWLGVFPSEISKYGMPHQTLSVGDKRAIKCVLKYPYMKDHPDIVKEVEVLINTNRKASIEGLIKNNTFLSDCYLPTKFFRKDFI